MPMDTLSFAILAMGANLPSADRDTSEMLQSACRILHAEPNISISAVSRFWRTPAVPAGAGPDYANAAALVSTALSPEELLAVLHRIEADFGRDRSGPRWSSRSLDLDLIGYKDMVLPDEVTQRNWMLLPPDQQRREVPDQLLLPHPRLQDRGFVLGPLAEIAPKWRHPVIGRTVAQMLADLGADGLRGMYPTSKVGHGTLP